MYFSGPVMTYRTGFSPIVSPLKYTRFCKVREKKLVYFSGSLKMKILVLKDKNFDFMSPLKHIRFFKVREKKLMYFIFPNLGPLKYTRFCKVRKKKLVYFSGSLNMKNFLLKDKKFHFMSPLKEST